MENIDNDTLNIPEIKLQEDKTVENDDFNNDHEPENSLIECDGSLRETSDNFVVIYCDGSCLGNGTPAAKAAYGVYFGPYSSLNMGKRLSDQYRQTNNSAEIVAMTEAVLAAKKLDYKLIEIRTDSKFLIVCVKKYLPFWLEIGWLTTTGQPVRNRPELEELYKEMRGVSVRLVHIKGNSGEVGNDRADFLA